MDFKRLFLAFSMILLISGCKGKKKNYVYSLKYSDVRAGGKLSEVSLAEDDYARVFLNPEGNILLYIVERDVKEGWGLGHGNEMISYDLERNLKLPLGKLGRSTMVKVLQLGGELKNAVVKTVDSDGNGDIDERDCNQLYLTATFGLEDEPVSPIGKNTVGVWQDPLFEWVVFAVSSDWPGRKKKKDEKIDPTPIVMAWNPETKMTAELAKCERFYGFTPDGQRYGCLLPGQKAKGDGMEMAVYQRGGTKELEKVTLPVSKRDEVFLLGGGRYVYTKHETSETGEKSTLWYRGSDEKDKRVTNPSVDSRIMFMLGDGSIIFLSKSQDSVNDFVVVRALSSDGGEVKTIFKFEGTDVESIDVAPNGKNMVFVRRRAVEYEIEGEVGKGKIFLSELSEKTEGRPVKKVAGEYIASLAASILKNLKEKLKGLSYVDSRKINVDIKKEVVFIQVKQGAFGEDAPSDDLLISKALEIKNVAAPVLSGKKYDGIIFSPDIEDAFIVLKWEERLGNYFTFLSAYGEMVPVREEYDFIIEDLTFRKMPGCKDPRLVQLHCGGWIANTANVKGGKSEIKCRANPLNPVQIVRAETEEIESPVSGGEAVAFDVVVDKVDPRRSHRYSYYFDVLVDGNPCPFYDVLWAEASRAWIDMMRGLEDVFPGKVIPYSGRTEFMQLLAKWRPDSVVNKEMHLDVHIYFQLSARLPPADDKEAWEAVAQGVMDRVTEHVTAFDEGRENEVRIALYSGNEMVFELWHKSPEELLADAMMDPNWTPPPPKEVKGKKKKKGKIEGGGEEDLDVLLAGDEFQSHVPPSKLGLPKAIIDKKEVQKVIKLRLSEVRYCYDKEAAKKHLGSGQITVRFVINSKGGVEKATVASATLKDATVQSCVLKAAARWKFPNPEGEGNVTVNYPFTFASGK